MGGERALDARGGAPPGDLPTERRGAPSAAGWTPPRRGGATELEHDPVLVRVDPEEVVMGLSLLPETKEEEGREEAEEHADAREANEGDLGLGGKRVL